MAFPTPRAALEKHDDVELSTNGRSQKQVRTSRFMRRNRTTKQTHVEFEVMPTTALNMHIYVRASLSLSLHIYIYIYICLYIYIYISYTYIHMTTQAIINASAPQAKVMRCEEGHFSRALLFVFCVLCCVLCVCVCVCCVYVCVCVVLCRFVCCFFFTCVVCVLCIFCGVCCVFSKHAVSHSILCLSGLSVLPGRCTRTAVGN